MKGFVVPGKELLVRVYLGSLVDTCFPASTVPPLLPPLPLNNNVLEIPLTQALRFALLGVQVLQVIRRPDNPPAGQCQPLHPPTSLS